MQHFLILCFNYEALCQSAETWLDYNDMEELSLYRNIMLEDLGVAMYIQNSINYSVWAMTVTLL